MLDERPPETVKECLIDLIKTIEQSERLDNLEEKGLFLDLVRTKLESYLKLKNILEM
jgi:hypothetical protein